MPALIEQYLHSADGAATLRALAGHGLDDAAARHAITVTAEEVVGPNGPAGLSLLLGGFIGTLGPSPAPIVARVAAQVGLSLRLAATVVGMVLPTLTQQWFARRG